jgi:hypothetical protein
MRTFNVIIDDFNAKTFGPYNIMRHLTRVYEDAKKNNIDLPKTKEEFKEFVIKESRYMWWSRCEYEIVLHSWPSDSHHEKWDIFKQIEMNIDLIVDIYIESLKEDNLLINYIENEN